VSASRPGESEVGRSALSFIHHLTKLWAFKDEKEAHFHLTKLWAFKDGKKGFDQVMGF